MRSNRLLPPALIGWHKRKSGGEPPFLTARLTVSRGFELVESFFERQAIALIPVALVEWLKRRGGGEPPFLIARLLVSTGFDLVESFCEWLGGRTDHLRERE